ncbi:MAG: ATP-binding protein [Burkholderiaceae bacterium]
MIDRVYGWSLRWRMALIAAFAMLASLSFGGAAIYWAASIQENQMLDSRLEHLAATVLSFVEEELNEEDPTGAMKYHNLKTRPTAALLYRYQVWSRDGALLMRTHEAASDAPLMPLSRLGFDTVQLKGEEYRAFSLPTKDKKFVIQVAENIDERWSQTGLMTAYYVGFLLIPFGLVFGATWVLLRRSLGSIDTMADQLRHRNPLDLTPLRLDAPPKELMPILRSIDTLFLRVGHALSAERRFTSVAAHEMRTPLAGLRAWAQLASSARNDDELQDALQSLRTGVDRASHMLDQLLDLARIEGLPTDHGIPVEHIDLPNTFQGVVQDLGPRLADKDIVLDAHFPARSLQGHAFAFSVLLRNLLANAVLYSPAGGRVDVCTEMQGDDTVLTVDDAGPGIRVADRERAFERFNRLGQTRTEGVGLGLSIVLSVVELHGARIRLTDSPNDGLRVEVTFRATAQVTEAQPADRSPVVTRSPARRPTDTPGHARS